MGDRYCDGVKDSAWKFINDSACPQGFDEFFCPNRFRCNANGNVSIDILQKCDGKVDCDDESDEICPSSFSIQSIFSSKTEMIESLILDNGICSCRWKYLRHHLYNNLSEQNEKNRPYRIS